jgi:arylsulfatase A-like enzyme/Flp pilus assembly protein TadD
MLLGLTLAAPAWAASPNVVLVTIDTVRADRVGCYGYQKAHTPTLDALAREGVLFRTTVASVPLTLPSHCSILTGAYPTLHGVRDNLGYNLGDTLPTLATILKQRGYATAAFVGADVLDPHRGLDRGFDTYSCPLRRKMQRDNPLVFNLQELQRRAEEVIADALAWMAARPPHSPQPFFVWIHLYDPHIPYDPPPRFRALLHDPYDGEIAYADDSLGKCFAYLKQHALYDPTLIVAASDHGESFGEHGEYTHGYYIYDTTLLVPFILKPPLGSGITPRHIQAPVRTIDIAPTMLQILGMAPASSMQGSSLLSLILGKTNNPPAGASYSETYYPTEFGWSALRALRTGQYKYIDAPKPELYDLAADPQENHNLYETQQAMALELKSQFASLVARVTPKEPLPRGSVSPVDVEALASLGYMGTSSPAPSGGSGQPLPDPKDELTTFRVLLNSTHLAAEKKCGQAIPALTRLTQEQPGLLLGHLTLAKCEIFTGQYGAAESSLNSALRLRPDNVEAIFYKGICQFQEGRLKEASADLRSVLKVLPNEPYAHFYLGSIYEKNGAPEQALEEYQKCATLDPDFEVAVYKVGYFLAKSGKFSKAIVQFKKVAEMDPGNAQAHFNMALAYQKLGNEAVARPEFEAACKLNKAMCLPRDQQ